MIVVSSSEHSGGQSQSECVCVCVCVCVFVSSCSETTDMQRIPVLPFQGYGCPLWFEQNLSRKSLNPKPPKPKPETPFLLMLLVRLLVLF